MKYYLESAETVTEELKTSEHGLTNEEAEKRLLVYGENKLKEKKKTPLIVGFLKQLADPMIIVLLAAALVSLVTTIISNATSGSTQSYADTVIIVAVVLLNAVLGVVQENKAEAAIEALQEMTASTCKVLRDGEVVTVKNSLVTIGDVVILEAGDSVPADCRIVESASLKIEESALTGESVPVEKFTEKISSDKEVPLGDRKNTAYMGSVVVYGRGKAVVTAVGMNTEMGKIADVLAKTADEQTPLQKKMAGLSKTLTYIVGGICIFIFLFQLIVYGFAAKTVLNSFMTAIGLAVAAIPEGLATVVTIVLSIGVTNMSKKNAVVRKLTAVEALGCAEIICSDKTGTLTQNKMTVVRTSAADEVLLATAMAMCNDAEISNGKVKGEPTEAALVDFAYKNGVDKSALSVTSPRVGEVPFDSVRKMMSTVHRRDKDVVQYTKGAPDEVLKKCKYILTENGVEVLTKGKIDEILKINKSMADDALRVLAAAYKTYDVLPTKVSEKDENGLIFIGLCGMIDPVRPEVKEAIETCRAAGIKPIMITGDHIDTAVAIAKELGIITDKSQAITGSMLDEISDEEFEKTIGNYAVYARVQPEHKVRIVKTWKKLGKITAMTGDGVNDAPSIKIADIGIGMGITGTDVTKSAADMVLADDNFATIVQAVGEGRRIYDNIRKAIQFLLSSNLAEVIACFAGTMLGFTILKPVHLLWINLITDTFPAIGLGVEKGEKDIMNKPPRNTREGIFARGLGTKVAVYGVLLALLTLASYTVGNLLEKTPWNAQSAVGSTMAFLTLSLGEVIHAFNCRSDKSIFVTPVNNLLLIITMAGAFAVSSAVVFIPGVREAFDFAPITIREYLLSLAFAVAIIPLSEVVKLVLNAIEKKKKKNMR